MPETEKEKLKEFLRCCPPDRHPTDDPAWAEAIRLVDRDPQMQSWHEREKEIDRLVGSRLKSFSVPSELRETLLTPEPETRIIPFPWLILRNAAVVVLAGGIILWGVVAFQGESHLTADSQNQPAYAQFSSGFFTELTGLFQREPEYDYFSDNLSELKLRVKEFGGPEASDVPGAIDELRGLRCRLFNWEQAKVALICMRTNDQSYHLFVIEDPEVTPPASPRVTPRFTQMENWAFASWGGEGKTYVLGTRGSRSDLEPMF